MCAERSLRLNTLFAAMGFCTMVAQIVIMRRIITVFGGNELATGAVFAGWLGFSGIGNVLAGRFADLIKDIERSVAISLISLAILIPATVIGATLSKTAIGIAPPVIVGTPIIIVTTIILLAPLGISLGAGFTFACCLPGRRRSQPPKITNGSFDIGKVYLLDALGAGVGGIVFSLIAIKYMSALQAALIDAAILVAVVGFSLQRQVIKLSSVAIVSILAVLLWLAPHINSVATNIQWRGYNTILEEESIFSNLMITDNRGERTLFIDGRPSFSLPLPETYETISHLPLLEHGSPQDIAIIGGGIRGVTKQLEKWQLNHAYFIRLDAEETRLEETTMPPFHGGPWGLPTWATIHHTDGRKFMKGGLPDGCKESCLDVIIINKGIPDTASSDRYFTTEFFREASQLLRQDGILCIAFLEPSNVIGDEAARLLGTVEASLDDVFRKTTVLPLDMFYFFASRGNDTITDDLDELTKRINLRGLEADYLKTWVLPSIFPERITSFRDIINAQTKTAPENTDRHPIAYHAGMMLWEARAGTYGKTFLECLSQVRLWMILCAIVILTIVSVPLGRSAKARVSSAWTLAAIGFSSIVYEIVLLVHYQMSEGLLVWRLGIIITAFMVGASAGTFAAQLFTKTKGTSLRLLTLSIALVACYLPLLFIVSEVSFIGANFIMGIMSGWVYQLSANRLVAAGHKVGISAGIVESSDHWGAAAGALIASLITVPLFGLELSLLMASAMLLAALTVLLLLNLLGTSANPDLMDL